MKRRHRLPHPSRPSSELEDILVELDWSNARLAEYAMVTENTVSRWLHGVLGTPRRLMAELRSVVDGRRKRRNRRNG